MSSSRHVSNNCWFGFSEVMTALKMPVYSMVRTRVVLMTSLVSIIINMDNLEDACLLNGEDTGCLNDIPSVNHYKHVL